MSTDATAGEGTPDEDPKPRPLGVLVTWRQTPRQAKALLAGIFVNRLAGFLQLFLVLFLTHRGYSAGQAGLALGMYGAGGVVGTFVGGWLSDRLTARAATMISMMGSAVLIASLVYVRFYPLILVAVLLVSSVGLLYRPAAQSLITELAPPGQLVMVTAMYRLCLNLGTTAAPLIGVALASVSYDLLFWAEALAALTYGLIALVALPRGEQAPAAAAEAASAAAESSADPAAPGRRARSGYLAVLTDWHYLVFLGAFLLIVMVYCQYTAALPLAIVQAKLSIWWYGTIVTLNAVIVVACEVVATKFTQTWPLRLTQLGGWSLLALGYGIYSIRMVPALLVIGTLMWTASEIVGAPTTYAYPGMVAPRALRGRYFGAMQSVFGLGSAIGPILGVELFDHVGQRVWVWAAAVTVLATVAGGIGMRVPAKQPAPDPVPEPAAQPTA